MSRLTLRGTGAAVCGCSSRARVVDYSFVKRFSLHKVLRLPSPRSVSWRPVSAHSFARFTPTAPQAATVRCLDITPGHILNTIYPDTATGAWMDDLSKTQVDKLSKPETIQGVDLSWASSP